MLFVQVFARIKRHRVARLPLQMKAKRSEKRRKKKIEERKK